MPGDTPIFDGRAVVEHLPGEFRRSPPALPVFVLRIFVKVLGLTLFAALSFWLWPLYWLSAMIYGRAGNTTRAWQVARYLRLCWTEHPPAPGLPLLLRCWLSLLILAKVLSNPLRGLAWNLDLLLYGRALRRVQVTAPLFEISAARSGSTQLARYLEDDPHLVAPVVLQLLFPYLWLWRLAAGPLGRLVGAERARKAIESQFPPEFLERHEGDPLRTDTFEAAFYLNNLNHLSPFLSPELLAQEFGFSEITEHSRRLWEFDFVSFVDAMARKTLLHAGPGPDGRPRRFFIKGHFLGVAPVLEQRYPDARFLTMIREPGPRLRSAINFLRVNPLDPLLGFPPWAWLGEALVRTEVAYCEREQWWFGEDGRRCCVLRFAEYVRDLEGAMTKVYATCLDTPSLPDYVPREHEPRKRTNYTVDRTLAQVGIDEAALNERLSDYIAWCRGED